MSVKDGDDIKVSSKLKDLTQFGLQFRSLAGTEKLIVKVAGATIATAGADEYLQTDATAVKTFAFKTSIINSKVTIVKKVIATGVETDLLSFTFIQTPDNGTGNDTNQTDPLEPLSDFLDRLMPRYNLTPQGWVISETTGLSDKEKRT